MQVTRKNRSASRRICRLINRDKFDLLDQRTDLKKWLAALQEGGKVAIDAAVGTTARPRSPPSRRPLSSGTTGTRLKPKDLNGGGLKSHHSPRP